MSKFEEKPEDWVRITLPNHTREDYQDILEGFTGTFPSTWVYAMDSPYDNVTEQDVESRLEDLARPIDMEAMIDLSGKVAAVYLNAAMYAETPADELLEEAERVLQDWAENLRQERASTSDEIPPTLEIEG